MSHSIRHRFGTRDHSRFIFAMLVAALMAVGGLLLVSSSELDVEASVQTDDKNVASQQASHTGAITPTFPSRILYVSYNFNTSSHKLHMMDPDGNIVFTHTTASTPIMADLSPDGSHAVYVSATTYTDLGGDIVVMNSDGTNERVVGSRGAGEEDLNPRLSPDNSKIVFNRIRHEEPNAGIGIYIMNADGTNVVRLSATGPSITEQWPDWSPDGTKIVYSNSDDGGLLYIMNANGSNKHPVSSATGITYYPAWSPDGDLIVYTSAQGLVLVNPDGTFSQVISNVRGKYPSWSPDGNWIVYGGSSSAELYKTDGNITINLTNTPSPDLAEITPSWGGTDLATVEVKGGDGLPVPGAQVFRNCDLLGTTNMSGTLALTSPVANGDELIARAAVYTGTTQKGSHDGWAYQVWLTNILENNDGTESVYAVTDTNRLTYTLELLPTNAQIGFNLVASVLYNTTPEHLGQIEAGFEQASEYLMDVTDGQMFFENVKLYEDGQHFNDADFRFQTWSPRASARVEPDGISALTAPDAHIHMYAPNDFGISYDQPSAFTTFIHEFGHYAIGAYDEYYKWNTDDYPTSCTVDFEDVSYDSRASIMFQNRASSEFCATIPPITHNDDTSQGYIQGESVWETLVDNWSNDEGLWELRSPMTRGAVNIGPYSIYCPATLGTSIQTFHVPGAACAPFPVLAKFSNGDSAVGADVDITNNGTYFDMADTDSVGVSILVGASIGDTVTVSTLVNGVPYSVRAPIESCNTIAVVLAQNGVPLQEEKGNAPATIGQWPAYWLTAVPDVSLDRVDVALHLAAASPATPTLYASQSGGNNRQAIALTYNSVQHEYTGSYTFSPSLPLNFQFDIELPVTDGVISSVYQFLGGQFHNTGPNGYEKMKNLGAPHGKSPDVAPVAWGLLQPESMADIVVKPSNLPDNTGVMVGEAGMPADAPSGLLAVGGPYSVQGQNPISGEIGITLGYLSEYYCGLVPGSTAIYRYTGTGWEEIATTLIEEWHQAGGKITQWGIYGVFAQINPLAAFSDVPSGSTFYDYINWITCHEIASGYSDGTFRPSNNATRGQISKMMSLTYQWLLEPPASEYTFADVLPGSTFHLYVEAAYREGVVSGYACGGAGEPCDGQNRPYFRPSNNVTRGQIAKIISNGSKFSDIVSGQTFEDVVPGSTFYEFVGRMASRSIINGYACGGAGEPCGVGNRPYFRPQSNATRGQLGKMIFLAAQPR